jgi:hypothetical protein
MKGVRHFGIKGKLAPRYNGPYPIINKYGPMSYQVELPVRLSGVHNVFHVSQLKTCQKPPSNWNQISHTKHIPSRFSTNKTESCATRLLGSTGSNGMITPKMMQRGNMKNSCNPTTPSFFHRGNHSTLVHLYTFTSISGRDSLLRGRANTLCYGNLNQSH